MKTKAFLLATAALTCFVGLARPNGYGVPQAAPAAPTRQFLEINRDRVETFTDYVPVQRQRIVRDRQLVEVDAAPQFAPMDCYPSGAAFGTSRSFGLFRSRGVGTVRQRSFNLQIQRSRFR